MEEAKQRLEAALALIEEHPDAVDDSLLTDILLHIARIKYFQFEFDAIIDLVQAYLPRVEALGDKQRLSRFLFEGGYANVFASRIEEGRKLLGRARALGEDIGDDLAIAYADLGTMWDRLSWGTPGDARHEAQREAGERIMAVGRRHGDIWLASKANLALGLDLMAWGPPGEGHKVLSELMAMSRENNDPRPRTMALWAFAAADAFSGNYTEAIENADEALRVVLSPVDIGAAHTYKAFAMIMSGQAADGMALALEMVPEAESRGLRMIVAPVKMAMGVGSVMMGEMARGIKQIEVWSAPLRVDKIRLRF